MLVFNLPFLMAVVNRDVNYKSISLLIYRTIEVAQCSQLTDAGFSKLAKVSLTFVCVNL